MVAVHLNGMKLHVDVGKRHLNMKILCCDTHRHDAQRNVYTPPYLTLTFISYLNIQHPLQKCIMH